MPISKCKFQRLLIITPHFRPETFRINEVAEMVAANGVSATVLTGQPNYPEGQVYSGFRSFGAGWEGGPKALAVARVPVITRGSGSGLRLFWSYLSFLVSSCVVGTFLLRGRRFDAILFYGVSPILLALAGLWFRAIKRAPLVLWVQDLWPSSLGAVGYRLGPVLNSMLEYCVRQIYRGSDMILVASRGFAADIERVGRGSIECTYHPNPAELAVAAMPPQCPGHSDVFDVLFAGNLGRASGLETVLDAAELLKVEDSIIFRLVGGGSRRDWLEQEIARRGLMNVALEGRVPSSEMPSVLRTASALLVTLTKSPAMALSLPSKTATYMATGIPLIVSADGETARIVEEAGAGLCTGAQDGEGLVDAIRRLKSLSADERASMGLAGRAYSEQWFDPSRLTCQLLEHLQTAKARYDREAKDEDDR